MILSFLELKNICHWFESCNFSAFDTLYDNSQTFIMYKCFKSTLNAYNLLIN